MGRQNAARTHYDTETKLQTQSSTMAIVNGMAHQLGVTRQAFVDAALKQAIHRYVLGISDPILPVPSFHRAGKRRHVADPAAFKECIDRYRKSDVIAIIKGVEHLEPVYPEQGRRVPFVPHDPSTYVKHRTRIKKP